MRQYENAMSRQVYSLPELIRTQYIDLEEKARTVLDFQEIFNIQRIILTGCGDSYAACMAVKHVFEMLTGIQVEVTSAIDLGRYYSEKHLGVDCQNPLVIAVSNSGEVARISEAVQRARLHDCFVLGITGNRDSSLAKHAHHILELSIPEFESAPGTRSYAVSVMALLLLAIRIGEVKGNYTMDQAMAYRYDMENQGQLLEELLPQMDAACETLALAWKDFPCFDFVGAGFDYAAAWFSQAKILEATGKFAIHINSEEWFHLNCFAANPQSVGTVVFANTTNPGLSRTKDVVKYARGLGRPLVVITDGTREDFQGEDAVYIRVPSPDFKINMPITQFVPGCLLAGYLSAILQETYGRQGQEAWKPWKDGSCVKNNEIIVQ